jgi:hypothetical protein
VAVQFLFPGLVQGVPPGGSAGVVPIFAGLVFLANGGVLRPGD